MGETLGTAVALTDMQLRPKLSDMVVNDLLGPASGPDEEITERNVHDRYLVGVLAPRTAAPLFVPPAAPVAAGADEDEDEDTPAEVDELAVGGDDSTDDG